MDVDEVRAYARDRLGMEPQAVAPPRGCRRGAWTGRVWWMMTEWANFWLVEDGAAAELLLAFAPIGTTPAPARCPTPARAVARFLELHPHAPPTDKALIRFTCRACGAEVSRTHPTVAVERGLCRRCRKAERGRERYRTDPAYRARCLAHSAAHYRRVRPEGPT